MATTTFHKDLAKKSTVLISVIFRHKIQDGDIQYGGSNDIISRHMMSWPIKMVSTCRASSGLSKQCKLISLCLNRTKMQGGGIPPTPSIVLQ